MRSTFCTALLHRVALYLVLMGAAWTGFYGLTLPADVPQRAAATSAVQVDTDATPGRDIFAATAALDASQIDDQRVPETLLVPEGAVLETTPMVPVPGTRVVVPEESPDGGYVLPPSQWLDNSPLYDDGWLLFVDDLHGTVSWHAPNHTQVATVAYSASTTALSGQCVQAARDILRASQRGIRIEEDLSYRGMPRRVAACNDELAAAYFADGHQFHGHHGPRLRAWLRQVIRTGQVYAPAGTAPVV